MRLDVRALEFGYATPLTAPLSFTVEAGKILGVLGPSGSGKSTLLTTIAGVQPALGGTIFVDETDITNAPIQQRNIGLVFQDPLLFPQLTVIANVRYGLLRRGAMKSIANDRANELLEWVGLTEFADRNVHELSGGQAQRVALARAIAPRPKVLLLDEPFSALDAELRERLANDVVMIARKENIAIVHVTHDAAEAARISDAELRI